MTNPTSNFGWQMPTSTDLVTDLPADFETFGQAVDTSLADLKGGTTGQVLSKASNTDMDFTWVAQDDSNAIQNAIVDAKGDLIAASAADTPARLAVGNNGETLVADSSTSTGLRYQSGYNANAIINGGMDIWQRGTSFTNPTSRIYTADRFQCYRYAYQNNLTISQVASAQSGFQYDLKLQRTAGDTQTGSIYIDYALETKDSLRFAGQTVTFSFYAKTGSTSNGFNSLSVGLAWATSTDQQWSGISGGGTVISSTATLTTSMQRFTFTGTVPTNSTQIAFELAVGAPSGTAGANEFIQITGVQLEIGSVASNFKRSSGGTIQGELAACQRYYYRNTATDNSYTYFGTGVTQSTTLGVGLIPYPVTMRVSPTIIEYSNLAYFDTGANTIYGLSSVTGNTGGRNTFALNFFSTGMTQYRPGNIIANNSTSAYVGFSAEL